MKEAYRLTSKNDTPAIDGMMTEDYAQNLEPNLSNLLERIKSSLIMRRRSEEHIYRRLMYRSGHLAFQRSKIRCSESDSHGAATRLRAALSFLLLRLQSLSLCSSYARGLAYRLHETWTTLLIISTSKNILIQYRTPTFGPFSQPPRMVSSEESSINGSRRP